ncbi:MAG: hypothetical protein R2733_06610 [Acidimicrobiales bacterium]
MLDRIASLTPYAPIRTVVNTHANGDHCYGNQLLAGPGVEFVTSDATSHEIGEVPAASLNGLVNGTTGLVGEFLRAAFGSFDFSGIDVPPVTTTFTGRTNVTVGGRTVELIGNWIAACDLNAELEPAVIVPGHGPLTDTAGANEVGEYLRLVRDGVTARHAAGLDPRAASLDLDTEINGTRFWNWSDRERLVATVHTMWKELEPGYSPPDVMSVFQMMAADWKQAQSPS